MIRYALICEDEHGFEAWFSNSASYDDQAQRGLVECPHCGSTAVRKQLMAPALATSRQKEARRERAQSAQTIKAEGAQTQMSHIDGSNLEDIARKMRAHIRNNFDYVGDTFAKEVRAMHKGEQPERLVYGETTAKESEALREEGISFSALPEIFTPTPPKKTN
ncbi:DUF1178 family protein [Woodsholea maritima]|uniref:DUF1178 family protein n=1 Tax=Woodsholea maritima TaxID=240237 RepID=UPI0003647711|nr:DUF1178 family protein [Woodsholea maritima]